ncbi:hypothetical protein [Allobranchiibius sp. CTAmp26]|uniref:hypothetical protein n=1 Tax=Allobranchiibius sp. CTAmp26 TaxID=2815214 RepID=UPI001AA0C798|nr:hypothetical protein [Allobranchiibius sp. CTAmp26]MBO1753809.1 hypothetical protein [Allobranchiibius sp. CTAmp26]
MRWIVGFGRFCWEFVIGDDWLVAALVVLGLDGTYLLAHATAAPAWWLLPAFVLVALPVSIIRLIRRTPRG